MLFNPSKCEFSPITNKKDTSYSYHTANYIKEVTSTKYLGVLNLLQINGFLFHNLKSFPSSIKVHCNLLQVTSLPNTLEYASSVWDPHTNLNIQRLEPVQRHASQILSERFDFVQVPFLPSTVKLWNSLPLCNLLPTVNQFCND